MSSLFSALGSVKGCIEQLLSCQPMGTVPRAGCKIWQKNRVRTMLLHCRLCFLWDITAMTGNHFSWEENMLEIQVLCFWLWLFGSEAIVSTETKATVINYCVCIFSIGVTDLNTFGKLLHWSGWHTNLFTVIVNPASVSILVMLKNYDDAKIKHHYLIFVAAHVAHSHVTYVLFWKPPEPLPDCLYWVAMAISQLL